MSDETTLLSCPFCKGKAELKEYKPNVSGVAICNGCGARSPICKNDHTGGWKPKAIAAWNTRAELGSGKPFAMAISELRDTVREAFSGDSVSMLEEGHAIMRAIDAVEAAELGSGTCWKVLADAYGPSGVEGEYLACSECCEWLAGDDCTGEADGPNFCSGCGAKVLGTLRCPKCGKVMHDQGGGGYALCECGYEHEPNCGKAVER